MTNTSSKPKPFPKGDVRRYITLLSAIERLGEPTLVQLERETGHNRGTIPADIEKIREQLCVDIVKDGACYRIENMGPLLIVTGIIKCLQG